MDLIPMECKGRYIETFGNERNFREADVCYHTFSSLPHQQVGGMRGRHIVLTARATRLQSDIITPFIFIQSDRERADDVQARPQLIAFQFECKC